MKKTTLSRRHFLGAAGTAAAACTIVPRHVLAKSGKTPPSEKLNIAGIGIGGQGGGDVRSVAGGNNIVALCDVDSPTAAGMFKTFPDAKHVQRLPQDVRRDGQADRRRARRHAGPHPRRGRDGRHAARQTRLLREAAGPLGRRGPRS